MSRAGYLEALHAVLDERRDPLDDAAVRDWLAAHPEDLPEFAALRAVLAAPVLADPALPHNEPAQAQMNASPLRPPTRRTLWPMALPPLAAAAALLLFLQADRAPAPAAAPEPLSGILASTSTVLVEPAIGVYQPVTGAGVLASSVTHTRNSGF